MFTHARGRVFGPLDVPIPRLRADIHNHVPQRVPVPLFLVCLNSAVLAGAWAGLAAAFFANGAGFCGAGGGPPTPTTLPACHVREYAGRGWDLPSGAKTEGLSTTRQNRLQPDAVAFSATPLDVRVGRRMTAGRTDVHIRTSLCCGLPSTPAAFSTGTADVTLAVHAPFPQRADISRDLLRTDSDRRDITFERRTNRRTDSHVRTRVRAVWFNTNFAGPRA